MTSQPPSLSPTQQIIRVRISFAFDGMSNVKDEHGFRDAVMVLLRDRQRIDGLLQTEGVSVARSHASSLARDAAQLAALIVGDDLLHLALLKDKLDDDPLRVIWHRLDIARPLIGANDDPHFVGLYNEVLAVFAGDAPQIFKKRTKTSGLAASVGFRLAQSRLEALKWARFYDAMGKAREGHQQLSDAFCVSWDAIRKWRPKCVQHLGKQAVDEALRMAGDAGLAARNGQSWSKPIFISESIEEAGLEFREASRIAYSD